MASKIHRASSNTEVVAWEPVSKSGAQPVRTARESGSNSPNLSAPELETRIHDLERQVEAQAQAAYQRGLQEGDAAGRQQATAQFQAAIERLARTTEELASLKPRLRHEAEEDVVKLGTAIARRILYRELNTSPEALLGLVRAALDKLADREVHRVRVNPQDAGLLQTHFQQSGTARKIEVVADAALARGSAIFETAHGAMDASVDSQLNEIERGFADLMRRSP